MPSPSTKPAPKADVETATTEKSPSSFIQAVVKAIGPKTREDQDRIQLAVTQFAKRVLEEAGVVQKKNVKTTIQAFITSIDKKLEAQINLILHHEDFQKLEGSWRGLHRMIFGTVTGADLKIKVLDATKDELTDAMKDFPGASFDQSPLFKTIYSQEFDMLGGHPFGCLIGDYYFDHSLDDITLLEGISNIASAAHCPFIAAAGPGLLGLKSWQKLNNPPDIKKVFSEDEYLAWQALRDKPASMYLGLTMPRMLAREPYGKKSRPVKEFAFEETIEGSNESSFVWSNAAYAMGANITKSFYFYGWCSRIRGPNAGGKVEDLPFYTFRTQGGTTEVQIPTEVGIPDSREHELSNCGLIPLCYVKRSTDAVFMAAQSLYRPKEYEGKDAEYANSNAQLSARLSYLFATCRFAHYLKYYVRSRIGQTKNEQELKEELETWIGNYVLLSLKAGEVAKAKKPLAAAAVIVTANKNNPGYYDAEFQLKPHYQLEGVSITLSLVSELRAADA